MKTWYTKEQGVPVSGGEDCRESLQQLIDRMEDGDELIFDRGTYYAKGSLYIKNRKGIKLKGYGSVFVSHYDPCSPNDCKTLLEFENSYDCSLQGFTFTTSSPTNIMGRIAAINMEESYFDIRVDSNSSVVGNEWIEGLDTCDENLSPNFHIGWADYGKPHRYRKIGDNVIRILVWPTLLQHLKKAHVGEIVCIRYSLYAPGTMAFVNCGDILIEDITVNSCPGICCVIEQRSSNFTFRRFNIRIANGSKQIMACNTDGIHVKGLTGYLNIEDCHFDNMGDDSLNFHSTCGTVFGINGNVIDSGLLKHGFTLDQPPAINLHRNFASKGDVLYFYDAKTMRKKAEATVKEYSINRFEVENIKGEIVRGDTIVNSSYYAKVHIKDISIRGSRARGMLIKTHNVVIEDSYFSDTAGAAICGACGIGLWNEMGPVHNMTIRNCVFENCGMQSIRNQAGGIVVGAGPGCNRHDYVEETGVFSDIKLYDNKFINLRDPAIFVAAVEGLEIKGNEMINCYGEERPNQENDEPYTYNTVICDCRDVVYENNRVVGNEKDVIQLHINT